MISKILFLLTVFLSNIIQCITGFAGTVLAMPFGVMLVGYNASKPILNILGIAASVYIAAKDRKYINRRELCKTSAVMILGICAGFYLKNLIGNQKEILYKLLGIIVIAFAVFNAVRFYRNKEEKAMPVFINAGLLLLAGAVHGMFVCGGPLLVTYYNGKIKDKREFRATISAQWIILNSIVMISDIKSGYFNYDVIILLAVSLAVLGVSLYIGNIIYKKMSRSVFLKLTYLLMLISGISLLLK